MDFISKLKAIDRLKVKISEPLFKHTTLGVGGNALFFLQPSTLKSLNLAVGLLKEYKIEYKIIGNGSNLLFCDDGFSGAVISLKALNDVYFEKGKVVAMAGVSLHKLINYVNSIGKTGIEGLSGIPATVGGAVCMNAGAFGYCISDYVKTIRTLKNGKIKVYDKENCNFSYRHSIFKNRKEIIVSATFDFPNGEIITGKRLALDFNEVRRIAQPSARTCGSIFKNPTGAFAGALIESAGLKGYKIGNATISNVHANFIEAGEGCLASQVYSLIQYAKKRVNDVFGISLEEEVEYVGEF